MESRGGDAQGQGQPPRRGAAPMEKKGGGASTTIGEGGRHGGRAAAPWMGGRRMVWGVREGAGGG
jgi:hypothetical protein